MQVQNQVIEDKLPAFSVSRRIAIAIEYRPPDAIADASLVLTCFHRCQENLPF
jgi:hypothetical protein